MKNKSSKSQNILSEIKRLEKSLKSNLDSKLKDTELVLMVRIEERAEKTERVLGEEIRDTRNDLMTKIDGIAKGLEDMREENTTGADLTRELEVKVEDHEGRITKLESPQAA